MPPLSKITKEKLDRLEEIPENFIDIVAAQNKELWEKLEKLIASLEIKDGSILATQENLAKIESIISTLKDVLFDGEYIEAVKGFIGEFSVQAELIDDIYRMTFENFSENEVFKTVLNNAKLNTLKLFDDSAIDSVWADPLRSILNQSVTTGAGFAETVKTLREYVLGDPALDPKLTSYVKRVARDAFAIMDRSYTQIVSKDFAVEYWVYSGGTVRDSREFCKARTGNTYTTKEIEGWANMDWQGKNPATNKDTIKTLLGGYNCIHSLIPTNKILANK